MKTTTRKTMALTSGVLAIAFMLSAFPVQAAGPAPATVSGNWLISQAAGSSNGSAPQVTACGTFTLTVSSASGGKFTGVFAATDNSGLGKVVVPSSGEAVTGSYMISSVQGQTTVRVMFSGSSPVVLLGSFSSPVVQPAPSTPTPPSPCVGISSADTLSGFVQLPSQGTEAMYVYSTQGTIVS